MVAVGWFRFFYALLGVVAVAGLVAVSQLAVAAPKIKAVRYHDAPLSKLNSAADVAGKFDGSPVQSVAGEQLGFPAGSVCDVYELSDGVTLICHAYGG